MRHILSGNEYMLLHDDGCISRPSLPEGYNKPSGEWRCTGAVTRNNFGGVTRRYSLAEVLANAPAIPWRFKNAKQRTFLCDLDHGFPREWRSPSHSVS